MKMYTMPDGIELIAETEHEKELLNLFHSQGVRVTSYDAKNHTIIIEKNLELSALIDAINDD
jgi:hypothetical protein